MAASKKILILHASAGHGHEKAAAAVAEALAAEGVPADLRDSLDLVRPGFASFYKNSYLSMIKSAAFLWGFCYYLMDARFLGFIVRPVRRMINGWVTERMRQLLTQEQPDVLVCTHFMSIEVAGHLKRKGLFRGRILAVVTDYLAHEFWVHPAVDVYAVGGEAARQDLIRRGVSDARIRVTGLPTRSIFRGALDGRRVRTDLGLAPERLTVLLTSGGAGVGPVERMALDLSSPAGGFQTLVVCGTNRALEQKLSAHQSARPLLRVFGFVNNMHELMAASDLIIGKAGGLTLAESFCLGVPIVMVHPVPGQEGRNARVTSAAGAGITTHDTGQTLRVARQILSDASRLESMNRAASSLGRPSAALDIARLALA